MLLREEIEQSFGDGPAHRPIEELVATGRRRVRRRRAAGLGAALATVAVLGATYAVTTAGSEGSGAPPIATDPTPDDLPRTLEPRAETWKDDTPLRYVDGELQIRPGVVVHEHIENPYGYRPPKLSDALDLTFRGTAVVDARGAHERRASATSVVGPQQRLGELRRLGRRPGRHRRPG